MSAYAQYKLPIVIDNGSGYSKLGFAGNDEPLFIIPTAVAVKENPSGILGGGGKFSSADMQYFAGDDAFSPQAANYTVKYPVRHGIVNDWPNMQNFMMSSIYRYLRVDPQEHYFLLTEPPLNKPENREQLAEIMFEMFGVAGLHIAVQAVLALAASWPSRNTRTGVLTGLVLDIGDGVTHAIPVADGYVIGSCMKHIPIAGREISFYIQSMLRDRGEPVPSDMSYEIAKRIKEKYCYVCPNIYKEFAKYDADPRTWLQCHVDTNAVTKQLFSVDVGYERFLAPEVFFRPTMINQDFKVPLPVVIDDVIQLCPIDVRRAMYSNIVLSGGTTMFKDFGKRLKRDIKKIVDHRRELNLKNAIGDVETKDVEVNVISHKLQRYAVWFGGSLLASAPEFYHVAHSRKDYLEKGPSICRYNAVFSSLE